MRRTYRSALLALVLALSGCGTDERGAQVRSYELDSEAVGRSLEQRLVLPEGEGEGRPLLIFLHGRSGDEESELRDAFYDALADLGDDAPVVVFPYGDFDSYWHDRRSGAWGRYVAHEVRARALRESGADPGRVAIGGISMGGFGAYDIARLYPDRFCAVGGHSAAIWTEPGQTAPGAFDNAKDFARHDLVAAAREGSFRPDKFWLDRGNSDPFVPGNDALAAAMGVEPHRYPGTHERRYWDGHWDEYLKFYANAC
jgi:poly(3-hydroxybutyrate) depolymerase